MASIIKVDTIQDQDGNNIINESANTITIGASGDTITIPSGATLANSGIVTGFQSTGIDDNATSTAITIDSSGKVIIDKTSTTLSSQLNVYGKATGSTVGRIALNRYLTPPTTTAALGEIWFADGDDNIAASISGARDGGTWTSGSSHPTNLQFFTTADGSSAKTERMRITSGGNVGIGTSSPDFPLEIYRASTSEVAIGSDNGGTAQLSFYENNSTAKEFFVKYDGLNNNGVIGTSAVSNAIVIPRDSGNVGIGTSSPSSKLDVQLSSIRSIRTQLDTRGDGTGAITCVEPSANNLRAFSIEGQEILFGTNAFTQTASIERMRIDSSGNVGIGTSSPAHAIELWGDGGNTIFAIRDTDTSPTFSNRFIKFQDINGTEIGHILRQGSSVAYITSSDYRIKENVSYDFDATTRLKQLKPARFNFIINPNITVDGFLAHEVQDIVPEAISGTKDAVDENGNPQYQGIDQSKLVPLLVKAIQELEARITTLETTN